MKILVSGSTGLLGSHLVPRLRADLHEIVRLVRSATPAPAGKECVIWVPGAGEIDPAPLEGLDAVIHLAGENVASARWTPRKKASIRDSRVKGTRFLSETLAGLDSPPRVLVSASAIGYYGNRGDESLDEQSPPGEGFLAEVCQEWESASEPAHAAGIRTVLLRIGLVLSSRGGALQKMIGPFRLGFGGPIGNGRQFMSWITIDDLTGVIIHCLGDEKLSGPVNAVAPGTLPQIDFARALGRALKRPTILPLPAFAVRLRFGEMGKELLLASSRVVPRKLQDAGFEYRHPTIEAAFGELLPG